MRERDFGTNPGYRIKSGMTDLWISLKDQDDTALKRIHIE